MRYSSREKIGSIPVDALIVSALRPVGGNAVVEAFLKNFVFFISMASFCPCR